jgi:hypothetical protein
MAHLQGPRLVERRCFWDYHNQIQEIAPMMSVHDALQAWQDGEITASRAMALSGAQDVLELYELAGNCGVEIRLELTRAEIAKVSAVTRLLQELSSAQDQKPSGPGARAA